MPPKPLIPVCNDCQLPHTTWHGYQACSGHITGTGKTVPCKKPPINGHRVCRTHGGAGANVKRAAQEKLALMSAQGEIAELMRDCDVEDQDPVTGLLEVVRVSGTMMRLLTIKVGELNEDPAVREVLVERNGDMSTEERATRDGFWALTPSGEMRPHAYLELLRIWTERYERACKTAIDAGIAERAVKVEEEKVALFATALRGILSDLELTPEQEALAFQGGVVRKHLMAIPSTTV